LARFLSIFGAFFAKILAPFFAQILAPFFAQILAPLSHKLKKTRKLIVTKESSRKIAILCMMCMSLTEKS
jgi:hypothetical protein